MISIIFWTGYVFFAVMNRLTTKSSCICTSNASTLVSLITNIPVSNRSAVKGNKKKNNNKKEEKQNNFCIFLNFVRFVLFLYFSKLQFAQIIWQTKSHKCCNRYSPLSTLPSPHPPFTAALWPAQQRRRAATFLQDMRTCKENASTWSQRNQMESSQRERGEGGR